MKLHFIHFPLLWMLAIFGPWVAYAWLRPIAARRAVLLHAGAGLCLILAAAGLQFQRASRKIQIVAVADISPSIYELNAQTARIRELLGVLDPESTEAAVVIFSETAALERSMAPLPPHMESSARAENRPGAPVPLPDLARPTSVVKMRGTDIRGALLFARNAFTSTDCSRAILLQSDFRDTHSDTALSAALFQSGDMELLATPSILGPSSDVQLAELRVPDTASTLRAVPIDVTVASQQPATVVVSVWRHALSEKPVFVGSQTVALTARNAATAEPEIRKTARLFDHPSTAGVAVYTASISGLDGPIPGDVTLNNSLSAAVRVAGPSMWAVLARANSSLEKLARDPAKPLGVETRVFKPGAFPADAVSYEPFSGIVVDGLSASELPESSAALHALARAVDGGKALVAIGGEAAFGAGGHAAGGEWEKILPVDMMPEDDRARAVLFIIDVSKSMDATIVHNGLKIRKMDFAAEQLQAVQKLRPQDRLGLIEFSGGAKLAAALSNEPSHGAFLNAIQAIRTDDKTDFLPALELAKSTLDSDDADEKLVILISDGVDTSSRSRDEILRAAEKLCPKADTAKRGKTTLWTFGIDVGSDVANSTGEALLIDLAAIGGGTFSRDFRTIGKRLSETLEQGKKEFYTRREPFVPHAAQPHALVKDLETWPLLAFRNRVKTKSAADTILVSGAVRNDLNDPPQKAPRSDPLLILSGPGAADLGRKAVLAVALDGADGVPFLAPNSPGRNLLAGVLTWAEARDEKESRGFSILAEPFGNDQLSVEFRAVDPVTGEPNNALNPIALFTDLQRGETHGSEAGDTPLAPLTLRAVAPGRYRGILDAPPAAVGRLTVRDSGRTLAERFVSTPCAAEIRRFGVDRAAMAELISRAGPAARAIESPRDMMQWAAEKSATSARVDARAGLIGLALVLLLVEYGMRGRRTKKPGVRPS